MPFSVQELDNIANSILDNHLRGQPLSQSIQDKPLLAAMKKAQKTFGGGKGKITGRVKNDYTTQFMGFSHDDTVVYRNPANIKQFEYEWKELHAGLSLTLSELKNAGISVVNSMNSEETTQASDAEQFELANIFDDKLEDMDEGMARSHNAIFWGDGTASPKIFGGVRSIITLDPTTGVVGGIDRSANTWWRNRAAVGANKITANNTNQTLTKFLRKEVRQLRRYGGKPSLLLCGSGFLEKLEGEVAEKGIYTQQGFVKNGTNDIGMADIGMQGVGSFMYDPTLDDDGFSNFCYFIDPRHIYPMVMQNEDMKQHSPARPPEKYVMYRGVTWTGTLIANKMNCHAVYEAA